jgi:hypothetical protein
MHEWGPRRPTDPDVGAVRIRSALIRVDSLLPQDEGKEVARDRERPEERHVSGLSAPAHAPDSYGHTVLRAIDEALTQWPRRRTSNQTPYSRISPEDVQTSGQNLLLLQTWHVSSPTLDVVHR